MSMLDTRTRSTASVRRAVRVSLHVTGKLRRCYVERANVHVTLSLHVSQSLTLAVDFRVRSRGSDWRVL